MDESMATMQIERQILREIRNETWHIEILLFIKQLFQIDIFYYYAIKIRKRIPRLNNKETQVPQLLIHYNFNSQLSLYFSVICAPPELKRSQIECRRALAKLQQSFSAGRTRPT